MLLVSLGLLALIVWIFMHNILVSELHRSVQSINHAKQQQILTYLSGEVTSAQLISNRELLRTLLVTQPRLTNTTSYNTLYYALVNSMTTSPDIIAIDVYFNDWELLIATNISTDRYQFVSVDLQTRQPDGTTTGTYYNGTHFFLQITTPITHMANGSSPVIGYLQVVVLSNRLMYTLLDPTDLGNTGEVYLIKNHSLVSQPHTKYFRILIPPRLHRHLNTTAPILCSTFQTACNALKGDTGIYTGNDIFGNSITGAYSPLGFGGFAVLTSMQTTELEEPIATLKSIILGISFGMFGVSIIVAYIFARLFTRPIRNLRSAANKLSHGDLDARVNDKTPLVFADEMAELGVAFNTMATEISHQYSTLEQKVKERTVELEEAKKQADSANLAKGYFLANMSHEIRTPLNGIVGLTDICIDSCQNEEQMKLLHTLKTSADHLLHLVNDILDYSKIDADKLELIPSVFSLREVIEQMRYMFVIPTSKKSMELVCTVDPNVPDQLVGDAPRLLQVLINLVGNAVKFTMQGSIKIHVGLACDDVNNLDEDDGGGGSSRNSISSEQVTLLAASSPEYTDCVDIDLANRYSSGRLLSSDVIRERGDSVVIAASSSPQSPPPLQTVMLQICVEDTGIGISKEDQHKLFEAFSQVESCYNRRFGGTGLGLAICRKLVELMNGSIWVESEVNKGTQFSFTSMFGVCSKQLPPMMTKQVAAADSDSTTDKDIPPNISKPLKILVAEDNAVNQLVITRTLTKLNHSPKVVSNGKLAVDACLYSNETFDVVLMDIQMPEMDGIEATRLIRESIPSERLPIVALTAHVTTGDMEKCTLAGMNYFITKPVDIRKLSPILAEIFADKNR